MGLLFSAVGRIGYDEFVAISGIGYQGVAGVVRSSEEEAAGSARRVVDSRRVYVEAALPDPGAFAV